VRSNSLGHSEDPSVTEITCALRTTYRLELLVSSDSLLPTRPTGGILALFASAASEPAPLESSPATTPDVAELAV
jgi:hypothetical protein